MKKTIRDHIRANPGFGGIALARAIG